ncbi:hypothetical protein QBC40DRAFT_256174 [Triangularia verruculosa]|uniref:Uncharacterized protein n=1 Tax=Triangularia verruculosa TaxID=2587418 RepID=A0AAN6XEY2_9PEZI|nr:hypothetical protein QBC40DRAFT_256174 [Triangularia verruculosa]
MAVPAKVGQRQATFKPLVDISFTGITSPGRLGNNVEAESGKAGNMAAEGDPYGDAAWPYSATCSPGIFCTRLLVEKAVGFSTTPACLQSSRIAIPPRKAATEKPMMPIQSASASPYTPASRSASNHAERKALQKVATLEARIKTIESQHSEQSATSAAQLARAQADLKVAEEEKQALNTKLEESKKKNAALKLQERRHKAYIEMLELRLGELHAMIPQTE